MRKRSELNMKNEKICPGRQTKQNQDRNIEMLNLLIKLYEKQENIKIKYEINNVKENFNEIK